MNQICGFARNLLIVVFMMAAIHAPATITVLDYWRLGEMDPNATAGATAITAIDGVGNHNLTFHGPATYSTAVAAAASTHTGSSLSVNFANGSYATNTIVSTNVDNFGIECWVNPTTVTNSQVIVYNGNTATSGWGIMVNGGIYEALYGGKVIFGTHPATAGAWTHLALVRTNGTATLYINGVAADSSSAVPNTPYGNFAIASPPQISDEQFLIGLVDEVRFFTFAAGQFKTSDLLLNQTTVISLSPSLVEGPAGGIDGLGVNASPASAFWTASTTTSWLHLNQSSGVNSNYYVLGFGCDPNSGPTRTGTITAGGQSLSVTQAGSNYVAAGVLTLPANGLNFASGVGVDGTATVYISDVEASVIDQWTPGSTNLTTWPHSSSLIVNPETVFVDNNHNILIANLYNDGQPLYSYGDFEWVASSQTLDQIGIGGPLTEDSAGNIYGNDDSTNMIFRFDWAIGGSWVEAISSGLSDPKVLAADRQGNLYLSSAYFSSHIGYIYTYQGWNPASETLTTVNFPGVGSIYCIAVDGANNLYIGDSGNGAFEEWNAASQTLSTLWVSGGNSEWAVAVDPAGNAYFVGNGLAYELPRAFVDSTAHSEAGGAGGDSLSAITPATASLTGFYQPTSDQPWLTITSVSGGSVGFAFTANASSTARTAHINILGVSIPITQASAVGTAPFLINPQVLGNGAFQFTFTNLPNASFTVLTTTNLSLPLAEWTVAGAPAGLGSGLYQFTSQPLTNGPQQFFEVTSP